MISQSIKLENMNKVSRNVTIIPRILFCLNGYRNANSQNKKLVLEHILKDLLAPPVFILMHGSLVMHSCGRIGFCYFAKASTFTANAEIAFTDNIMDFSLMY